MRTMIRITKLFRLLGFFGALRFIWQRIMGRKLTTLRIKGADYPITCRTAGSDIFCINQIFGNLELDVDLGFEPKWIIDGGANIGTATIYYAQRYPDAMILAIEPDQTNYELLLKNVARFPNVTAQRAAIWKTNATVSIANPTARPWGYRVSDAQPSSIGLPGMTIPALLDLAEMPQVDLLKLDIEGAETVVFSEGPMDWLKKCQAMLIEIHGPAAQKTVEAACRDQFTSRPCGDKIFYLRKTS